MVPKAIRLERSKRLRILSSKKQRAFYQNFDSQELKVLFESDNHDGFIRGFTENYLKVQIPYSKKLVNQIIAVKLVDLNADCIYNGKIKESIFA